MKTRVFLHLSMLIILLFFGCAYERTDNTNTSQQPIEKDATQTIHIDLADEGRIFEGIGALSAGASSRLLIDYPEPQRSQILDLLFKPKYGAALQNLKIEIGGDINSTDGTEPSHARTRDEYLKPQRENFLRGYEWWLLVEAKKRNPNILLDCLPWGFPGWIGDGNFYTQEGADYITQFIKYTEQYLDLKFDYTGIWNETMYDIEYIKMLRKTLDKNNLEHVKIIAADQNINPWKIAEKFKDDPELEKAIYAIGDHYPGKRSTKLAKETGKPLHSAEDGIWFRTETEQWPNPETPTRRGIWPGALELAKIHNLNYINGKMTRTIVWSLISSYYLNIPFPYSGLMTADTPWSGYYVIDPAIWSAAHTTQFTEPGWVYIDSACKKLTKGGSVVTLKDSDSGDYSIIIETSGAKETQTVNFKLDYGVSKARLAVWESNSKGQFIRTDDIKPKDNAFTMSLEPDAIYSVTTTRGQQKADLAPPPDKPFPLPYSDDFESYPAGQLPKYICDQSGIFETTDRNNGRGKCLRQVIPENGIEWHYHRNTEPQTFLGSLEWKDYQVSCDVYIEDSGSAKVLGRVGLIPQSEQPADGYSFTIDHEGNWQLKAGPIKLIEGKTNFIANTWHNIKLKLHGETITVFVDNTKVIAIADATYTKGQTGLGTGWNHVRFDNLRIEPSFDEIPQADIDKYMRIAYKAITASSSWDNYYSMWSAGGYQPQKATDGNWSLTRWNAAKGTSSDQWLQVDFDRPTTFNKVIVKQFMDRIIKYRIQYLDKTGWKDAFVGRDLGTMRKTITFGPVTSKKMRFYIVSTKDNSEPSIWELAVYNDE